MSDEKQKVNIKITDDVLMGRYSNYMQVSHTSGEFVLLFANIVPPTGAVVGKIFVSPGHLKRIIRTLEGNVKKYEEQFGEIKEAQEIKREEAGF